MELSPATGDFRSLPLTGRFCSWLSGQFSARQSCKKTDSDAFSLGCPTAISTPCMSESCQWTRSTRNFSQVSYTLSESSVRCTIGQETGQGRSRKYMTNFNVGRYRQFWHHCGNFKEVYLSLLLSWLWLQGSPWARGHGGPVFHALAQPTWSGHVSPCSLQLQLPLRKHVLGSGHVIQPRPLIGQPFGQVTSCFGVLTFNPMGDLWPRSSSTTQWWNHRSPQWISVRGTFLTLSWWWWLFG